MANLVNRNIVFVKDAFKPVKDALYSLLQPQWLSIAFAPTDFGLAGGAAPRAVESANASLSEDTSGACSMSPLSMLLLM